MILNSDPLLVKAARGDSVIPPPAWVMHQAGRYMAVYRKLAEKHPSFRERSEKTDLIVEISLQPWEAFQPGVVIFSDTLTPVPALGVIFDIEEIVSIVRKRCPNTPLVLYINGNGGLVERMKETGVDVVGLDWKVGMADGRKRLGNDISIQGNVDPAYLFSTIPALTDEIKRVVECAGKRGHILNLGHGVFVGTPEEAVAHFFDVARCLTYDEFVDDYATEQPKLPLQS